jgi:hypothetical protein
LLQAMDTVPQVCCTIVSPDSLFNVWSVVMHS